MPRDAAPRPAAAGEDPRPRLRRRAVPFLPGRLLRRAGAPRGVARARPRARPRGRSGVARRRPVPVARAARRGDAALRDRLLAGPVPQSVSDRAYFYLARIGYQRGYPRGRLAQPRAHPRPAAGQLEPERRLLAANVLMAQGRFSEAVGVARAAGRTTALGAVRALQPRRGAGALGRSDARAANCSSRWARWRPATRNSGRCATAPTSHSASRCCRSGSRTQPPRP